jgi:hypothetical protein
MANRKSRFGLLAFMLKGQGSTGLGRKGSYKQYKAWKKTR